MGSFRGHLGAILASGGAGGASWSLRGPPGASWGRFGGVLGPSVAVLRPSWGVRGGVLGVILGSWRDLFRVSFLEPLRKPMLVRFRVDFGVQNDLKSTPGALPKRASRRKVRNADFEQTPTFWADFCLQLGFQSGSKRVRKLLPNRWRKRGPKKTPTGGQH